jgi:iron complex outermembrane receptor protein
VDPFLNFFTRRGGKHQLRTRWYYSDNNNNNGQSNQTDVLIADYSFSRIFHKLNGLNATGGFYFSQSFSHANLYAGGGSPDNQLKNRAAFIQLNHNFLKVLQVSAGVRGEYFQINDEESAFRPVFRSGVNLKLTKTTFLRASYGQGFRYPTIAEKFVVTSTGGINVYPNPDIKAESSSSMEAGVKQSFRWGQFSGFADLAFFQQEYENMIEYVYAIWVPDYPGFKFVNTGNTRVQGAEFSVAGGGKVGRDMELRFLAGYTYVKPQTLEPNYVFATDNPPDGILPTELTYVNTSTDTTDNILKYRFRHLVKADVEFSFKRFTVGASARYYSYMQNIDKLFYDLDQPGLLETGIREYREENDEGSLVFDARASVKVGRYYQVALISNNIANLEYTLRPLKIESPRTIALQVTAKF